MRQEIPRRFGFSSLPEAKAKPERGMGDRGLPCGVKHGRI